MTESQTQARPNTAMLVKDLMTAHAEWVGAGTPVTWCFEDQSDAEATKLMESKNIRHLPVLSRAKRIVGMLSFGDLALRSKSLTKELLHMAARDALRNGRAQPAD